MDYLDQLCEFAASTGLGDIDDVVADALKNVVLDTLGVMVAGARESTIVSLARRFQSMSRFRDSSILGRPERAEPFLAAIVTGTSGTWYDLDSGNRFAGGHPAIHIVPAALALAERQGASGTAFLESVLVGYEVAARVGIAMGPLRKGMHPHGSWPAVGVPVAGAKLLGYGPARMRSSVDVVSSMTLATSFQTAYLGATVRNSYSGLGAGLGLMALDFHAAGFTSDPNGVRDVFGTVVSDQFSPDKALEGLGTRYEVTRNYFKQYACCRYAHSSLDALIDLHDEQPFESEQVESVDVSSYSYAATLSAQSPQNPLAAKFSLPHLVAAYLVTGSIGMESSAEEAVGNPAIRDLASRVTVRENVEFTAMLPESRPSRVTVRLRDGRVLSQIVMNARGDEQAPFTRDELNEKFHALCVDLLGEEKVSRAADMVYELESVRDVRDLTRLLTTAN